MSANSNTPGKIPDGWRLVKTGQVQLGDKLWTPEVFAYEPATALELDTPTSCWKAVIRQK